MKIISGTEHIPHKYVLDAPHETVVITGRALCKGTAFFNVGTLIVLGTLNAHRGELRVQADAIHVLGEWKVRSPSCEVKEITFGKGTDVLDALEKLGVRIDRTVRGALRFIV